MTASNTTPTPLAGDTLTRKWYLDVNTVVGGGAATWTRCNGVTNLVPNMDDANFEDDSDFDGGGFSSKTKTAATWSATGKFVRKVTAASATAYDPGQEFLRLAAIGKFGLANRVELRIYEMNGTGGPQTEAYHGFAGVQWSEDGGAMTDLSMVSFTLNGQGQLDQITHPAKSS